MKTTIITEKFQIFLQILKTTDIFSKLLKFLKAKKFIKTPENSLKLLIQTPKNS
jgi:hypothetical protein